VVSSKTLFWTVFSEKNISCDINTLWEVVSSRSCLELFHPFCKKNKIIKWSKEKSIDQIEYLNGLIFRREFFEWEENKGYKLYIHQIGKPKSKVEWKIKGDNRKSIINISVNPYLFNSGNKFLNIIPYHFITRPFLKSYLDSVTSGLKYYIEQDKIVTKNQYGKHIWFS
tara:strand:- start:376 stop:882 length:507 start_codon:yes stop_codon:yes gene_type:complete